MKGIILAGGTGTRLYPATIPVCKQLLPIYDKPLVYYPLSTLMLAGIREILIITNPSEQVDFKRLLGDGSQYGLYIVYEVQEEPNGIAEAFKIASNFIGDDSVCLVLGDNIFYGHDFKRLVQKASSLQHGACVFGYHVRNPQHYGVVEFDDKNNVLSIEEKPENPKSNYAVVGLYFYDNKVIEIANSISRSDRGELEITDVNEEYRKRGELTVSLMGRGFAWLDAGTHDSMLDASNFVKTIEDRQGQKIACIEEIAWRMGYIDRNELKMLQKQLIKSGYGEYLKYL